jgi:hypothetical protein
MTLFNILIDSELNRTRHEGLPRACRGKSSTSAQDSAIRIIVSLSTKRRHTTLIVSSGTQLRLRKSWGPGPSLVTQLPAASSQSRPALRSATHLGPLGTGPKMSLMEGGRRQQTEAQNSSRSGARACAKQERQARGSAFHQNSSLEQRIPGIHRSEQKQH